jgi:hypothetical protein
VISSLWHSGNSVARAGWVQQGVGPELLKEGQGQSQVQAVGEKGENRSCPPTMNRPETKDTLGRFTLEPEAAWLLGSRELQQDSGFSCSLGTRARRVWVFCGRTGGIDPSWDPGPHHEGLGCRELERVLGHINPDTCPSGLCPSLGILGAAQPLLQGPCRTQNGISQAQGQDRLSSPGQASPLLGERSVLFSIPAQR